VPSAASGCICAQSFGDSPVFIPSLDIDTPPADALNFGPDCLLAGNWLQTANS